MATLTEINFNYNKAMSQVAELNSIASNLKKVGNTQISECMREVSANWESENSKSYVAKGNKLKEKIDKSAANITKVAQTLSQMAENIKNTEMKNIEIVNTNSNK